MIRKTQVVVLEVATDATNDDPVEWNWAELLDCDPDLVRVVDHKDVVLTVVDDEDES